MAPADSSNWLSFSLHQSSMEMLTSSSSQPSAVPAAAAVPHHEMLQSTMMKLAPFDASSSPDSHHYYFADNFYAANGWGHHSRGHQLMYNQAAGAGFMDTQIMHHHDHQAAPPKLEDFLGGETAAAYSQTETQDSSLTHLYENQHHPCGGGSSAYFNDHHQDLKSMAAGFQAFSNNSGSEVDDSGSVGRAHVMCGGAEFTGQGSGGGGGHSIESSVGTHDLAAAAAYTSSQCCPTTATTNGLSLGVNDNHNDNNSISVAQSASADKAIVDSESCKKITDTFGQRTSIYRGVTRHRWTGRYEAHLWDNSCRREGQARKGRQVYLGGYDKEEKAARAYDLAALKYWGPTATTNFPVSNYTKELEEMKHVTKQEFIASLRRKSSGFSRGASIYRGVTRHHQQGRWQARIGRVAGNKDLYLGTFATEAEAAEAYDIAAIKFRGVNAVTNFEMNRYDVEAIAKSALPIGGAAKRLKLSLEADQKPSLSNNQQAQCSSNSSSSNINFASIHQPISTIPCGVPFDTSTPFYHHNLFHHLQSSNGGASDTSGSVSSMVTPMPLLPSPAEFFIWPHQSY